jgi:hypothetical protein
MTKEQWIRGTALVIQMVIRNVDNHETAIGFNLLDVQDRAALGECLDWLKELEGDL